MKTTIERLRALLLDEGWSQDHRADALKTLAEIEAAWDALLAPVDVEAEVNALLGAMRGVPPSCAADVAGVVRPLVTDRARLAREVERLECEATHLATVAAIHRAEVARLTAQADEVRAEVSMLVGGLNDIFGKGAHPAPREALEQVAGLVRRLRFAAPGEARDRDVRPSEDRVIGTCLNPGCSQDMGHGGECDEDGPFRKLDTNTCNVDHTPAERLTRAELASEASASAAALRGLPWPRERACNVDHSPDERPRVTGGECAECLHRPPLHEPTCTKARCTHVVPSTVQRLTRAERWEARSASDQVAMLLRIGWPLPRVWAAAGRLLPDVRR